MDKISSRGYRKSQRKPSLTCYCNDRESFEGEGHEKNQPNETIEIKRRQQEPIEINRQRDKEDHEI
jgi:Ribonuclease G/E